MILMTKLKLIFSFLLQIQVFLYFCRYLAISEISLWQTNALQPITLFLTNF